MYLAGNYTHTHTHIYNMLHTTHIGRRASLSGLSNLYSSHSDMDAILAYLIPEQNKKKKKNLPTSLQYSMDNIIQHRFDFALNFLIHFSWLKFQGGPSNFNAKNHIAKKLRRKKKISNNK
jgi:hypothetical protein